LSFFCIETVLAKILAEFHITVSKLGKPVGSKAVVKLSHQLNQRIFVVARVKMVHRTKCVVQMCIAVTMHSLAQRVPVMCLLCCLVDEFMNELQANVEEKIDEHLAEQREIEALDEG